MSSEANSATRDRIVSDLDELYSDLVELRANTKISKMAVGKAQTLVSKAIDVLKSAKL
jgi:hypothetical protein